MKKNEFKKNKIIRISTVAFFVDTQLNAQIKKMVDLGLSVSVCTSDIELKRPIEGIEYFSIEIPRQIDIVKDLFALIKIYQLFKKQKYDIIHSTTPKAGLLCALAGKFAGVPVRIHTFTGQPWVTLTGVKKNLAKISDKIIGYYSTACYADSDSQKNFLISENIIHASKINVLGKGSISGVNLKKFNPDLYSKANREEFKKELGIPNDSIVFLFVGRIVRDKGVIELVKAFSKLFVKDNSIYLLMVGPQELNKSDLGIDLNSRYSNNILFSGYTDKPEQYMSISDVLCIPSYREGFGTVVIEAAAMGLPAIGTNIYGLSDAIIDGETGFLVNKESVPELLLAMEKLVFDDVTLKELGCNARKRAIRDFSSELVNSLVVSEYFELLSDF